jgi:hypothetical protein
MSLISQKDREVAIKVFEHYCDKLDQDVFNNPNKKEDIQKEKNEIITLLNWIKLEYFRHEN